MTSEYIMDALNDIDFDMVEDAEQIHRRPSSGLLLRRVAVAACLCLLISVTVIGFLLQDRAQPPIALPNAETTDMVEEGSTTIVDGPTEGQDSSRFDPVIHPDVLNGWPTENIISGGRDDGASSGEPPAFRFQSTGIVVKATIAEIYPDSYCKMTSSRSSDYRLIRFKVLQGIHGERIPQDFLYLLPAYLFVDLSPYDTFILSMAQVGAEGYVMRNESQQRVEALMLPVFGDFQNSPELGNIIAFTDGIFNESLWQNKSWIYGYQFARYYLDNPDTYPLVVYRGYTVEDTLQAIREDIEDTPAYKVPSVVYLDFETEEARAALDYVKPFENGVFVQELRAQYYNPSTVRFRRCINGCQTDETITINLDTEEVTYSDVRYSDEEITGVENLPQHIGELTAQYKEKTPTPPHHVKTEEQTLYDLELYGWYVKAGDMVYGIIRTTWRYHGDVEVEGFLHPVRMYYYDDAYLLYDPMQDSPRVIDRDELIALVGRRNIYTGEYGLVSEFPFDHDWYIYEG